MKTENWNGHEIRFVNINDEWWAVAKDVTTALSIRNNRDAIKKLDADEKGVATIDTLGGEDYEHKRCCRESTIRWEMHV